MISIQLPTRTALIVLYLVSRSSGLLPQSGRGSVEKSSGRPCIVNTKFHERRHIPIAVSASIASGNAAEHIVDERIQTRKERKDAEEFQWLNWVYKQWKPKKAGELSEEVLKQMMPAVAHWSRRKTSESARRSEELLERIIEENLAGNEHAELTVNLFNAAMHGHAKIGNPDGVQRILRRMESIRSQNDHLGHLKPDVFSMSTLATAWAKSRSPVAATKAENILQYMDVKNLTPNTITYNAVLHALAMGNQIDRALRAEDVVRRMEDQSAQGADCKPDIYSYQSVIQAWARTSIPGSPQKAERILRYLDEEFEKGDKSLAPNAYCFTTAIHAWAMSTEEKRARSAYEILQHMRKRYTEQKTKKIKPNVVAFTAVLNACSRPVDESERKEAFKIAQLTMSELSLGIYDSPNFISYAAFLTVCAATLDEGDARDEIVRNCFKECIEAGQFGQIVAEKLKIVASPALYNELLGRHLQRGGIMAVPKDWTRNIKGERAADSRRHHAGQKTKSPISESSKLRLKAVKKFGGKSGVFSGNSASHSDAQGILWSQRPLGS